jgi:CDP-4-dehydro-6-deoxyglucose reductase/ferredoxin-NAD(P)+ reductase (naphthalene dioxygenase ferredoxin-specific)
VLSDAATLAGCKAYLAGPPPMVEAAVAQLRARGLSADDIHADPFYSEEENRGRRGEIG